MPRVYHNLAKKEHAQTRAPYGMDDETVRKAGCGGPLLRIEDVVVQRRPCKSCDIKYRCASQHNLARFLSLSRLHTCASWPADRWSFGVNEPRCDRCDSSGWVCQSHMLRPSTCGSQRPDACACSAGVPCPDCNAFNDPLPYTLHDESGP